MSKVKKLSVLKKSDHVSICFGEWFDKSAGNTCYDAEVSINGSTYQIAYRYGYNAGDVQSINEALAACGYRVRNNTFQRWAPYASIHTYTSTKLKRELFKA